MPAIPPSLPPSVEEAYRRKCIQLRNRTNEVEDANDAARLRLARIKRQVEKLRIERAFLLEQLAKRTSTNVEDSDGSPSPPPTDSYLDIPAELRANPRKPKDKPLRTKRGHRKSMAVDIDSKANADSNAPASPASESQGRTKGANGVSKSRKKPADAFEVYCDETRPALEAKSKDAEEEINIDDELAAGWKDLSQDDKDDFQAKFEQLAAEEPEPELEAEAEAEADADVDVDVDADAKEESPEKKGEDENEKPDEDEDKPEEDEEKPQTQDEDVEMGEDTEDQDTQGGEKAD